MQALESYPSAVLRSLTYSARLQIQLHQTDWSDICSNVLKNACKKMHRSLLILYEIHPIVADRTSVRNLVGSNSPWCGHTLLCVHNLTIYFHLCLRKHTRVRVRVKLKETGHYSHWPYSHDYGRTPGKLPETTHPPQRNGHKRAYADYTGESLIKVKINCIALNPATMKRKIRNELLDIE